MKGDVPMTTAIIVAVVAVLAIAIGVIVKRRRAHG